MVKMITTRQQVPNVSHFKVTRKNISRLIDEGIIIPHTLAHGGRSIHIFSSEYIASPKITIESHREEAIRKSSNTNKNKDNFTTITIPKQEAIDIYSMRSKLPSASNGQIKGFDKLLQGLHNLNDEFVTISKENRLVKFTNKEKRIIGKLTFKAKDLLN